MATAKKKAPAKEATETKKKETVKKAARSTNGTSVKATGKKKGRESCGY